MRRLFRCCTARLFTVSLRVWGVDSRVLHSMARRYLMDRYGELIGMYAQLPNQGRVAGGLLYSLNARRIFPRYNTVDAMLVEVERLDPDRLPDPHALTQTLHRAADNAQSPFTRPPQSRVEQDVIDDERGLFRSAVDNWTSTPDLDVEPLGYRRVLRPEESEDWRRRIRQVWGLQDLTWYPMLAGSVPQDVLVLREESMWDQHGIAAVRAALYAEGGLRVAELREYGTERLLDVDLFTPTYDGAEGVWSDDSLAWIAYASHEGTVAFGGLLASVLSATLPNLSEWQWSGW